MAGPKRLEELGAAARQARKAEATAQLRQALEGLTVKSLFDFIGRTETSRGVRSCS
ncbi:hypothetical protein [Bacillus sp. ISL-55]|uniref:hypothetical protein n=1 Tax=Bacillus sp. ISL-55 TaxID=2819134 RepID=UPI001BE55EC1|nr:hypothetical protein [Bacillus sp. ISL-55]MBT2693736.1 hypothetical protein [Bacillus sp. ISL-55]